MVDFKLELVLIPVSDVDRAKDFYVEKLGCNLDVDHQPNDDFRVVQMTPPGSACSITIGKGITDAKPGSYRGTHLVVTDIEAAREQLRGRGVDVSEVRHMGPNGWQPGPHPERTDYGSFADFADPDGNTWVLQERGWATSSAQPERLGVRSMRYAEVNGQPGAVYFDAGGRPVAVVSLDIADDLVQTVRAISNPDKLRHLTPPADSH